MIDLKPLQDRLKNTIAMSSEWDNDLIYKLIQEIQYLRALAKGCCCSDGEVQDILKEPASSFNENNPFPTFGGVVCHKCNGLNVLVNLNIRQRKEILDLYKELDQVREEREKIAALLVKQTCQ